MTDNEELQAFFGERRTDLIRFAALQLRDQSLAEDAVQETLMAAMQAIDRFEGRSSLKTWVFSILKRKIIDAMRSARREIAASQLTGGSEAERDFDELFDERGFWHTERKPQRWTEPEDSLEQQQFWRIFELCLDHLPARTAQVFSMRELLGLDTDEICKELGISTSNCWVILHRARMGLRLCLEEQWFNKES
jgi:RNA polymerase sigma-70 factor (ECF subfamily)